jgi:hypothetical protein
VEFNNNTEYWTVTAKDLDNSSTIYFKTVAPDLLYVLPQKNRKIEDLEQMSKIEEYTKKYRYLLRPELG